LVSWLVNWLVGWLVGYRIDKWIFFFRMPT